jgi:hypothetical protein
MQIILAYFTSREGITKEERNRAKKGQLSSNLLSLV